MPLDPAEERWLRERLDALDRQVGRLLADEQQTNRNFLALHGRLKAVERQRAAFAALAAGLVGSVLAAVYWGGRIETEVKQAAEANVAVKELAKEFHEHERRSSIPRSETQ
jgi:hypothetical protein